MLSYCWPYLILCAPCSSKLDEIGPSHLFQSYLHGSVERRLDILPPAAILETFLSKTKYLQRLHTLLSRSCQRYPTSTANWKTGAIGQTKIQGNAVNHEIPSQCQLQLFDFPSICGFIKHEYMVSHVCFLMFDFWTVSLLRLFPLRQTSLGIKLARCIKAPLQRCVSSSSAIFCLYFAHVLFIRNRLSLSLQ